MITQLRARLYPETIILLFLLALTGIVYGLHWGFTVDDAAISFSYARNFAEGYGLGSLYPGAARVAGYSNLLWVILLGIGTWIFHDTLLVSKLLGLAFALGSVGFLYLSLRSFVRHRWLLIGIALLPISLTFSFWSVSGLENSFYTCLLLAGVYLLLAEDTRQQSLPFGSPVLLLLASMTRPEGVIYGFAGFSYKLLQIMLKWSKETRVEHRQALRNLLVWSAIFFGGFLIFKAWHYAYFAYFWPNPIYAKANWYSTDLQSIWFEPQGWTYLRGYFRTFAANWILPVILYGALVSLRGPQRIFVIFGLTALVLPLYTPDWMVNYRFLYPFLPFQTALIVLAADQLVTLVGRSWLGNQSLPGEPNQYIGRRVAGKQALFRLIAVLLAVWFSFGVFRYAWANIRLGQRQLACGYQPMAELPCMDGRLYWSMGEIDERYQDLLGYARIAGVKDPLYLIPDIGATSYLQNMRLLDLAGLADVHIAQAREGGQLKQYLFHEQRPEFIVIQGIWARRTDLAAFNGLYENYLSLNPKTRLEDRKQGTFIRKDLIIETSDPFDDEAHSHAVELASGLSLLGVTHQEIFAPGYPESFDTYWQVNTLQDIDWGVQVRLLDRAGKVVYLETEPLGYGWYPTSLWNTGETIRQHIHLPEELEEGRYTLEISALDEQASPVRSVTFKDSIIVSAAEAQLKIDDLNAAGEVYSTADNPIDAMASYQQSLAIDPDQPDIVEKLQLVMRQAELQLLDSARNHWRLGNMDALLESTRSAAQLRGRLPAAQGWIRFGRELRQAGDSVAASNQRYKTYSLYLAASLANPDDAWAQRGLERARYRYILDAQAAAPAG